MHPKGKIPIFSFLFITLLSLSVIIFLGIVLFLVIDEKKEGKTMKTKTMNHVYQYLRKNHNENQTTVGIVSLPFEIEENEFISHEYEFGDSILISNFGEEEYECIGTCYCTKESARRNGLVTISRGITYLLVSISSFIAFEKAKSYFSTSCVEVMSEKCEVHLIRSSIDECRSGRETSSTTTDENEENRSLEGSSSYNEDSRTFFCFGNCVKNLGLKNPISIKHSENKVLDCEKLKREGEVLVYDYELVSGAKPGDVVLVTPKDLKQSTVRARGNFQRDFLVDFCKENSRFEYIGERKQIVNGKEYTTKRKYTGVSCTGVNRYSKRVTDKHGNVKCRQISPKPSGTNAEWLNKRFWENKGEWDS